MRGYLSPFFLVVFFVGSLASLSKGPIWGLLTYVYVYYNIPGHQWWGYQVPNLRWSFWAAGILIVSCILHRDKLASGRFKNNAPGKWLLGLIIIMVIIAPFTPDPDHSWLKVYDFFRYVLVFFIVVSVLTTFRQYKLFIAVLLFCTFYLSILAQHYFSGARLDGVGLPDAADANMLAALFLLMIPLYVVLVATESGWPRWLALLPLPFIMNAFAMCSSRGGFVGLAMQGLVAMWLLRKKIGMGKSLICCLLVASAMFYLMDDKYRDRILGISEAIDEEARVEASAGRWEVWQYGMEMAYDYPLGAGGDGFMALSQYYLPGYRLTRGGIRAAHNTFLTVWVEQGIAGLVVFIGFLWGQFRLSTKARRVLLYCQLDKSFPDVDKMIYHTYALQISLAGFWAAAFFIDRVYFEGIYLVVAAATALSLIVFRVQENVLSEQRH